jgi:diguanylate cyclase (GGDEF)-like protein
LSSTILLWTKNPFRQRRRNPACVRPYDAVGRFGGEEFLILLPGCDATATADKAEQLRATVGLPPIETLTGTLRVTMSIGAVAAANWPDENAKQVLLMVDAALYRANHEGRNRVVRAGGAEHEDAHHPSLEFSSQGQEKK